MAKPEDPKKKGTFGVARLPVALKYVFPDRRRAMMRIGGAACLALLLYFLADLFLFKSNFTASGPLSTYHATFEEKCEKCHEKVRGVTKLAAVTDDNCAVCHEKTGAKVEMDVKAESTMVASKQKVYTFPAHYIYRSMNASRVDSAIQACSDRETPCFACHQEHLGRFAKITNVPDNRCIECHKYGSFNETHPEFEFALKEIPDDSTLRFTHIRHVKEVMKKQKVVDVERVCLYCHNPKPDGKNFNPIEYDYHCGGGDCHLTAADGTLSLPIKTPSNPRGLATLSMIRAEGGLGTEWANYMNPNLFQTDNGSVSKTRLSHEDPWVMENLKRIRRQIYRGLEISELLKTSGKLMSQNNQNFTAMLYQEALKSLQSYAAGLRLSRAEPEIQDDLDVVDLLLKRAQRLYQQQISTLGGDKLLTRPPLLNPNLGANTMKQLDSLALALTQACQVCHVVRSASIQRMAKDQRILNRAEFNHRAHILDKRCLECHNKIPLDNMAKNLQFGAAIQNVPDIENCRECHNASQSSNRCVTCHYFHPNKTNRSSLQLYLD